MRTGGEAFVLVDSAAVRIRAATAPWSLLKLGFSEPDHLIGVTGAGERQDSMYDTGRAELTGHVLSRVDHYHAAGVWYRARPELHECHAWLMRTGHAIPAGEFRNLIIEGWRQPPADAATPVITHVRDAEREWAAWSVSRDYATAAMITVLRPPGADPLAGLPPAWPLRDIAAGAVLRLRCWRNAHSSPDIAALRRPTARTCAVAAHLRPVAAQRHVAPDAGSVTRLVVERLLADGFAAGLDPPPGPVERGERDGTSRPARAPLKPTARGARSAEPSGANRTPSSCDEGSIERASQQVAGHLGADGLGALVNLKVGRSCERPSCGSLRSVSGHGQDAQSRRGWEGLRAPRPVYARHRHQRDPCTATTEAQSPSRSRRTAPRRARPAQIRSYRFPDQIVRAAAERDDPDDAEAAQPGNEEAGGRSRYRSAPVHRLITIITALQHRPAGQAEPAPPQAIRGAGVTARTGQIAGHARGPGTSRAPA